ncbi:hypothetical protein [Salana multivorans]
MTGPIATYATILSVIATPSTTPASPPATSKASRPRATVSSPVPSRAMTCAPNSLAYTGLRKTAIIRLPSSTRPDYHGGV